MPLPFAVSHDRTRLSSRACAPAGSSDCTMNSFLNESSPRSTDGSRKILPRRWVPAAGRIWISLAVPGDSAIAQMNGCCVATPLPPALTQYRYSKTFTLTPRWVPISSRSILWSFSPMCLSPGWSDSTSSVASGPRSGFERSRPSSTASDAAARSRSSLRCRLHHHPYAETTISATPAPTEAGTPFVTPPRTNTTPKPPNRNDVSLGSACLRFRL